MPKVTKIQLTDQWFLDNGYWFKTTCQAGAFKYEIVNSTTKWLDFIDQCFKLTPEGHLITEETMLKVIAMGELKRHRYRSSYRKLTQEEKDERRRAKHQRKYEEERKLKDAIRNSQ
jgi:hypothetical protein